MSIPAVWSQILDFFDALLVIEPLQGQLSGTAGLHPIRQFNQRVGLVQNEVECIQGQLGKTGSFRNAMKIMRKLFVRFAFRCPSNGSDLLP
jgi:hypothetical protein